MVTSLTKNTSILTYVKSAPLVQALRLCTGRMAHRGSRGIAILFHDHSTRRGEGSASRPGLSLPRERPGTHCTGGWVGPRAGLDRCGKSHPPPGFDPRTVHPVSSHYTDWTARPTLCKELLRISCYRKFPRTGCSSPSNQHEQYQEMYWCCVRRFLITPSDNLIFTNV